jgi:signal transduction histidine kinase
MMDVINSLGNWILPEQFMPHGHCYLWDPWLLRQNVISNALIGLSYYSIPVALVLFVKKRKDLSFNWIFFMFSAFIFACGTTHFLSIFNIWWPAYRLDAALMSVTAGLSVMTAIALIKLMPKLLAIPSIEVLTSTIAQLEHEVHLRRTAENELSVLNANLDAKVSERTHELEQAHQRLAKAKNAVELQLVEITKINEELNNFSYIAAHDLKSPLRGIDQLATWIAEDMGDNLTAETLSNLRLMRSRIQRMERLLNDLLAYSRVGRSANKAEMVDTAQLVADVFDMTATATQYRLQMTDNLPTFYAQKIPLELVFRNLIANAIKHHDRATGTIGVSARSMGDGVEFAVEDDGPGIAPEHHIRVFGIFKTLRPRDAVEGSGIGLALVKKAVESVGGTVRVESNGHRGCIVKFTWPGTKKGGAQ